MTVHIPQGFRFSAATAGLKASGSPDLVLALSDRPASAAVMFTTNQMAAAPVIVGKQNLRLSEHILRAIIVNSGNANCATGDPGLKAAERVCQEVAHHLNILPHQVLPSSTGIIGVLLPAEKIIARIPDVVASAANTPEATAAFARAIMTTDTKPKTSSTTLEVDGKRFSVLGFAKGAGMIHPDMATMLAYIFTDVAATPAELSAVFRPAVARSFNAVSIDGDTSTNDTAALLANGASGVPLRSLAAEFAAALQTVCDDLAFQIVADGEGVQHVVRLTVTGAESDYAAHRIANVIATSPLVKTAWAGADPNWGRIIAATGRAGETVDLSKFSIAVEGTFVCRNGAAVQFDAQALHQKMQQPRFAIDITVGEGSGHYTVLTCDLSAEYVRINADYST